MIINPASQSAPTAAPTPRPSPSPPTSIRVGMLSNTDIDDPNPLSGMPYHMARALRQHGIDIIPIPTTRPGTPSRTLPARAGRRIRGVRRQRTPLAFKKWTDDQFPRSTRRMVIRDITARSLRAQQHLDLLLDKDHEIHALFGCCISSALYRLQTDLPIIYFSDATSVVIQETYPKLAGRGEAFRSALRSVEHIALGRTHAAVFASPRTRQSAIDDFGLEPERTYLVPMGAHVLPDNPDSIHVPADPPSRARCDLLIVAADPIRKRVDLAVRTTELLRDRGINATLHVIGPGTPKSAASPAAESHGPLRLSDPTDRDTHQDLLARCHLQLLPSVGEAFGIAPIESAHFARPSIVSDAGGLPFVVLNNQTGLVLPVDAVPDAWADAAESLIDAPETYLALSTACLARARQELNWTAWGRSMRTIIDKTIAAH